MRIETLETLPVQKHYSLNIETLLLPFCLAIWRRFSFVFASARLRKRIPFCEQTRLTLDPPFLGGCNARRKNTVSRRRRFHGTLSLPPPPRVVVSPLWIPTLPRNTKHTAVARTDELSRRHRDNWVAGEIFRTRGWESLWRETSGERRGRRSWNNESFCAEMVSTWKNSKKLVESLAENFKRARKRRLGAEWGSRSIK